MEMERPSVKSLSCANWLRTSERGVNVNVDAGAPHDFWELAGARRSWRGPGGIQAFLSNAREHLVV
jgi:hypothetical protein